MPKLTREQYGEVRILNLCVIAPIGDSPFRDFALPALSDYADACGSGKAGHMANEIFTATNGVVVSVSAVFPASHVEEAFVKKGAEVDQRPKVTEEIIDLAEAAALRHYDGLSDDTKVSSVRRQCMRAAIETVIDTIQPIAANELERLRLNASRYEHVRTLFTLPPAIHAQLPEHGVDADAPEDVDRIVDSQIAWLRDHPSTAPT